MLIQASYESTMSRLADRSQQVSDINVLHISLDTLLIRLDSRQENETRVIMGAAVCSKRRIMIIYSAFDVT